MSATPARGGYSRTAKVLHWVIAALVLGLIPVGLSLDLLPQGPIQDFAYLMHKSTGFVVLLLMILRLGWRLACPPPPPEPDMPRWQQAIASANHYAFYAILLTMPWLGWAGSNAFGAPVSVYGLFTLPNLVGEDKELAKTILGWHAALGITVAGLILLHIGAVLFHRFVRRDAVLARMT